MEFEVEEKLKNDILPMVFLGVILALIFFGYGVYSLTQGNCTLIGRGNPPIGTFVTFYGSQARLVSTIYLGIGILLFARFFLRNTNKRIFCKTLSYVGVITILFGLCSSLVIMLLPLL